jgi:hypothetical protein
MSKQSDEKYRPSLSYESILHLMNLCRETISDQRSVNAISVLAPFEFKIKNGAITAAYKTVPKLSKSEELGFTPEIPTEPLSVRTERAYKKWEVDPSQCSVGELKDAMEYRYHNDLMSQEEIIAYELKQFK